jgi:hypothetical protein
VADSEQGLRRLVRRFLPRLFGIESLLRGQSEQRGAIAYLVWTQLLLRQKYLDPRSLAKHGSKVYSQAEEDGIIYEIFRRIKPQVRNFLEIGVSHGRECNTRLLLRYGWSGTWIEYDRHFAKAIREYFSEDIASGRLRLAVDRATPDNINGLMAQATDSRGLDLLSIDIDGNDYHVLDAMDVLMPRVIVLEYNPVFLPPEEWVMEYDPAHGWHGGDRYGASLQSYEIMLARKGYALVGCTLNGNNAFFVQRDLLGDMFVSDTSAEYHYEPQRFWLTRAFASGHSDG